MPITIKKGTALSSLSMTPLIDIVFLLLIFFLVTTRFSEEDHELEVMLPTASEAKPLIIKPKEIFINIDNNGKYFVGNKMVDLEKMETQLASADINNPTGQTVIIRADKRCQWESVVAAINACQRAGIHDVRPTTAGDGG
jgi:biopolymer transport protein ExbD